MLTNARVDVTIPVVDLERAKSFYAEKLGLREMTPPDPTMADENALFEGGDGTRLALFKRPHRSKAEHTLAAFEVDDLEAAVRELKARGVEFERYEMPGASIDELGIVTAGSMKGAWFKDSEGNILGLGEFL